MNLDQWTSFYRFSEEVSIPTLAGAQHRRLPHHLIQNRRITSANLLLFCALHLCAVL